MVSSAAPDRPVSAAQPLILVVDDEAGICLTLQGILEDEGYRVSVASDGETAIRKAIDERPDLVMLDIWMPGMDGLETLKKLKSAFTDLPVVMMSGHASISTAIAATKLGARDFIEKPLDLVTTVRLVRTTLEERSQHGLASERDTLTPVRESVSINPVVFKTQTMRGRKVTQKTIAHSSLLYGQGLHSGKKSGLILEPLPPNSGIHFVGVSETTIVPGHVDFVESTGYATTLKLGDTQVSTIEHLMSALHAYGISNLLVKCNGEVPVMDGSARDFCKLLEEVGLEEQDGDWYEIEPKETIEVGNGEEWIRCEPWDEFTICYQLKYPEPIGAQTFEFVLTDPAAFKEQIAPSRTFSFVRDIGYLQKQGLAQGGRFDNFVLIGDDGAINDKLRFADEPARHKILDIMGDLYLLGRRLRAKITAHMTGHSDNIELLKKIREKM